MADKNKERPPVIVILGHVDHGKSSILEAIKDFRITAKESGGITQHIGAYEIEYQGKKMTFIDTPGHEAFSAMRSRGAKVADIAILVIAADEGIKPQTKEAIEHIKNSGIPMIVALNKIDRPAADSEKVKRELLSYDVSVESMGGSVPAVEVSAKEKKGINELLEMIVLVSEMEELKADTEGPAKGVVVESYKDSLSGPIATLIVEKGVFKKDDNIGTPSAFGKIKGLKDFMGHSIKEAGPSKPVIVLGFEEVPDVGDEVKVYSDLASYKKEKESGKSLSIFQEKEINPEQKILNIIIKADVFGSLEAIEEVLKTLPQDQTVLRVLKAEAGDINDFDVKIAKNGNAKIIGFRVKTSSTAKKLALKEEISIINFDIIYELSKTIKNLLEKTLEPEIVRTDLGRVKILAVFKTEKSRQIIGGKVMKGIAKKGAFAEVLRKEEIIGKGKIINLQKDKKDADKAEERSECGMVYEGNVKIEEGDILNIYIEEKKKREL